MDDLKCIETKGTCVTGEREMIPNFYLTMTICKYVNNFKKANIYSSYIAVFSRAKGKKLSLWENT